MKFSSFLQVAVLFVLLALAACKEAKNDPAPNPTVEQGFFYAENSSITQIKTDDTWANAQYHSIIAQQSGATVVEINLKSLAEGTYSLTDRYAFTYVKGGHWEATAGSLVITKNKDGKLSGTFEATAGSGVTGINAVKGSFTDISIK